MRPPRSLALAALLALSAVPGAAQARDLRVITYNTWGLPRPLLVRPSRLPAIRRELATQDADVVALQETFTSKAAVFDDVPGYPYRAWGTPGGKGIRQSDGLLILSRHPIVETATTGYSDCEGTDCLARKGALHARIRLPDGREIDVFTTHLNAGLKGGEDVRVSQVQELFRFVLERTHGGERPFVLLGDFNTVPGSPTYRELRALIQARDGYLDFASSRPELDPVTRNGFTMDPRRNANMAYARPFVAPMRIDYVWLGGYGPSGLRVDDASLFLDRKVDGHHLSDHFGIRMDLSLDRRDL